MRIVSNFVDPCCNYTVSAVFMIVTIAYLVISNILQNNIDYFCFMQLSNILNFLTASEKKYLNLDLDLKIPSNWK